MLTPDTVILKMKLNFYHHLANLPEKSLRNEFFRIQSESEGSLPSIVEEVKEHVSKIGDPTSVSKGVWKMNVKHYINNMTRNNLLESMKKYEKVNHAEYEKEPFERKKFLQNLDLEGARMRMRISMGMVNTVRSNFKQSYKDRSLTCQSCKNIRVVKSDNLEVEKPTDSQVHLMEDCEAFQDIRAELDLQSDADIVTFFKKVIQRRIENGEE